jgi:hypothetical protein
MEDNNRFFNLLINWTYHFMIQEGREAKDLSAFFMLIIEILDCFRYMQIQKYWIGLASMYNIDCVGSYSYKIYL